VVEVDGLAAQRFHATECAAPTAAQEREALNPASAVSLTRVEQSRLSHPSPRRPRPGHGPRRGRRRAASSVRDRGRTGRPHGVRRVRSQPQEPTRDRFACQRTASTVRSSSPPPVLRSTPVRPTRRGRGRVATGAAPVALARRTQMTRSVRRCSARSWRACSHNSSRSSPTPRSSPDSGSASPEAIRTIISPAGPLVP
jgi:hypothetical protein